MKHSNNCHTHHPDHVDHSFISKVAFLDSKQRERLIPPESLIDQMPIQSHHTLLDVGAGSGFFTIPMAEKTSGTVYAMDPDKRMLDVIEAKAREKELGNIECLHETIENFRLEDERIDFVMASLILHELESLPLALARIFDVMSAGGHLLCLEYEKDESLPEGPPMSIRIPSAELERTLSAIGFDIVGKNHVNDAIYTILAVKRQGHGR